MVDPVPIQCPWCWETIEIPVDVSAGDQACTEDCSVCCRPISVRMTVDPTGVPQVQVERE